MKQAYAYVRVSTAKQLNGDGPERQAAKIENYIQAAGLELLDTFIDTTKGKNETKDRKEMFKMLAKLAANPHIKIVVVERSDRLARNFIIAHRVMDDFRKLGVKIISADGGIDITEDDDSDPQGKLMRQILMIFAEYEKNMGNMRLAAGRERAKARGERGDGEVAYGQLNKKNVTPEKRARAKVEQEIIERMFACKAIGMSYRSIARELSRNTQPRYGHEWTTRGVINIMAREEKCHRAPVPSTEMILYCKERREKFAHVNGETGKRFGGLLMEVPAKLQEVLQGMIEGQAGQEAAHS